MVRSGEEQGHSSGRQRVDTRRAVVARAETDDSEERLLTLDAMATIVLFCAVRAGVVEFGSTTTTDRETTSDWNDKEQSDAERGSDGDRKARILLEVG